MLPLQIHLHDAENAQLPVEGEQLQLQTCAAVPPAAQTLKQNLLGIVQHINGGRASQGLGGRAGRGGGEGGGNSVRRGDALRIMRCPSGILVTVYWDNRSEHV